MRIKKRIKKSSARPTTSFTAPTWILLSLTILLPLIYGIYLSFLNVNLSSFAPTKFIGLANYKLALTAPETYSTLVTTLQLMVIGLIVQIPLGIAIDVYCPKASMLATAAIMVGGLALFAAPGL